MKKARRFRKSLLLLYKGFLILSLVGILTWVWWNKYPQDATYYRGGNILVIFLYLVLVVIFATLYGATRIGVHRLGEVIYSLILTLVISNTLIHLVLCLIARRILPVWWLLLATGVQLVVGAFISWRINKLYFKLYPPREMVVIYANKPKARSLIRKMSLREERYQVCVALADSEPLDAIFAAIDQYGAVTLCDVDPFVEDEVFTYCNRTGKRMYMLPSIKDIAVRYSSATQLFDTPLFYCKNSGPAMEEMILKRTMDIVISAIALLVLSPLLLVVALAIKLYDGGPALYKQKRLTRHRHEFWLYKFRSMKVDAEKEKGAQLSTRNDNRITPIGRVIRALRIDEFPQLYNILKGDMSLVGPRPERPEMAEEFEKHLPDFGLRLHMKAGLTGYAQVHGNYNTAISDKLLLDMIYIENYSLLMDFNILFMTLKIIFMPEATEGIAEGATLPDDMQDAGDEKK